MRPVLGCLLVLAGLALPPYALAGSPGTSPPGTSPGEARAPVEARRNRDDVQGEVPLGQRSPGAAVDLEGRVTTAAGAPLADVAVKAFANGLLVGSVQTDKDGTFSLSARPMHDKKGSAVIWFESPDPTYYPDASIVLWADKGAAERKLFPACTQSLHGESGYGKLQITLRSMDELQASVIASKCLEEGTPATSP